MAGYSYLNKPEIYFYFFVYIFFLSYGIYQHIKLNKVILEETTYSGFTQGWSILNRQRDDLDFEWETWKTFVFTHLFWFILHICLTEVVRYIKPKLIPHTHAIIGTSFVYFNYNLTVLTIILLKNCTFQYFVKFKRKSVIWICAIVFLTFIIFLKLKFEEEVATFLALNDLQIYEIIIIFSWNLMKFLSYSLDSVKSANDGKVENFDKFNIINNLGYIFYLPNFLLGPLLIYRRYCNMLEANRDKEWKIQESSERFFTFVKKILRCIFWLFFTDFSLHYIYLNNLQYNMELIKQLNPWAMYTFGYLMGQFFLNKYVVTYGFSLSIAEFDRIVVPELPKCIGRIHFYSDMWKYFDRGLYEFLFIYIYTEMCQKTSSTARKLFANLATFLFIYLWHGVYTFVLIWSILNFICVHIEQIGKWIGQSQRENLEKRFSTENILRLRALFGSQLFIPAAMSNFYFFGGIDVGNVFMIRTYLENTIVNYLILSFCCYCTFHTSEVIKRWQMDNKVLSCPKNKIQ